MHHTKEPVFTKFQGFEGLDGTNGVLSKFELEFHFDRVLSGNSEQIWKSTMNRQSTNLFIIYLL